MTVEREISGMMLRLDALIADRDRLAAEVAELREALAAYVSADFDMGGTSSKAEIHNARLTGARALLEARK